MADRGDRGSVLDRRLERRSFLKVAGLSMAGLLGSRGVLASVGQTGAAVSAHPTTEAPPDAIFEKAAELEFDTQRIFRFVADEVHYEPYLGCLRGARGALASRAGNSVDQAVLLASLLSAAAIPVRFVSGPLGNDQADALYASTAIDLEGARSQHEAALRGAGSATGPAREPTAAERDLLDALPDVIDRTVRLIEDRTDRATRVLMTALEGADIRFAADHTPMPDLEVQQHTWVQAALGPDWVDLDPSMPNATEGVAHAEPAGEPRKTLLDELRHRVEIVLTTESISGGALKRTAVIEHAAYADELAGQAISFSHEKPEGLEALGLALQSVLQGGIRYQPILSVGDVTLVGIESLVFGSSDGALDEAGDPVMHDGESTAEWLDIRVVLPDREMVTRRTLFDRVGDVARDAGTFDPTTLPPVELTDIDAELTAEYAPMRVVHFLDVATGGTGADRFLGGVETLTEAEALALYPATFQLLRDGLASAVGLPRGVRTFLDAPNIVDFSIALKPGPAGPGEERVDLAVDLLVRSAGTSPLVGSAPLAPASLVAAVLEHEAERLAAGDGPEGEPFPDLPVDSVGAVLEAAAEQGVATLVLREASEADALPLRPDVASRLKAGLNEGWVAVVPAAPVQLHGQERIGWWLVNTASGSARDVFEDGRGRAATEETTLYYRIAFWVRKFVCLGLTIKQAKTYAKFINEDYVGFAIGMAVGYPLHKLLGGHCH
jgi:hypothetical protein